MVNESKQVPLIVVKCAVCGHEGGIDVIEKKYELVGVSVWMCVDYDACARRVQLNHFRYGLAQHHASLIWYG